MVLALTFSGVCLLYATAFLIGLHRARRRGMDVTQLGRDRRSLADPVTRRFQQWCQREKMDALRQKQWTRFGLLIFANNLGAVALVGRTLYGVAIVPAVYFTYRQGVNQGIVFAHVAMRPHGVLLAVLILEFGAYLLAAALGLNVIITPIVGGLFSDALWSLARFYPVIAAALCAGAWLEVHAVRSRLPGGFALPPDLDMEQLRTKALEAIRRHSTSR